MKLCRFQTKEQAAPRIGLLTDDQTVMDLSTAGVDRMLPLLESDALSEKLAAFAKQGLPRLPLTGVTLLTPVEQQEVWAAGVTYLRSKIARMEESDFSASAYDRVYDAVRPEVFFKSLPHKVVPPGGDVGMRKDSKWNVPEPELAVVVNSAGAIIGWSICNDMSSRDIEGENPLYLPQAKVYDQSCGLGPCILVASEPPAPSTEIRIEILRAGAAAFAGATALDRLKRSPRSLVDWLLRDNSFPAGCFLSTGTGIVPPDSFTLQSGDEIRITIGPIGTLINTVG